MNTQERRRKQREQERMLAEKHEELERWDGSMIMGARTSHSLM
jgi:hypothetical protein